MKNAKIVLKNYEKCKNCIEKLKCKNCIEKLKCKKWIIFGSEKIIYGFF